MDGIIVLINGINRLSWHYQLINGSRVPGRRVSKRRGPWDRSMRRGSSRQASGKTDLLSSCSNSVFPEARLQERESNLTHEYSTPHLRTKNKHEQKLMAIFELDPKKHQEHTRNWSSTLVIVFSWYALVFFGARLLLFRNRFQSQALLRREHDRILRLRKTDQQIDFEGQFYRDYRLIVGIFGQLTALLAN